MAAAAARSAPRRVIGALLAAAALAAGEPAGGEAPVDRLAGELIGLRSSHHRHSDSDRVPAYQQCGGNGIDKKCESGCLCLPKSKFYSGCKPIPGESHCNLPAAKGYLAAKKHRAAPLRHEKERTLRARAEKIAAYKKAAKSTVQLQLKAAAALSQQAVLREAATMEAVEHDNAGKIKEEVKHLKEAEAALAHTRKVAEKEAQVPVDEAKEALAQAKRHLEKVKAAGKERVANTTAAEDEKVKKAKEMMNSELGKTLGPELEERKKKAAEAKQKAKDTAEAKVRAIKAEADTKEARDKAAKEAAKAAKKLKPAERKVQHWKAALV